MYKHLFKFSVVTTLLLSAIACKKMENPKNSPNAIGAANGVSLATGIETVTVDFSQQDSTVKYRSSGLLNALLPNPGIFSPPDIYVIPIKSQFHRLSPADAITLKYRNGPLKMKVIVVLSDAWGYNKTVWPGGTSGNDWAAYKKFLHDNVVNVLNVLNADSVHFDIWNEPNTVACWNPTNGSTTSPSQTQIVTNRARFCQTYNYAVKYLRLLSDTLNKRIIIEGPSMTDVAYKYSWESSGPNYPALKQWIDSAKYYNTAPDYLTWHFPGTSGTTPSQQIAAIKTLYGSGVPPVINNEIIDDGENNPGRIAWLASEQQRAYVIGSAHAYFGNLRNELDYMIYKDASNIWHTRGEWWWWTRYGRMSGKEVATTPSTNLGLYAASDVDSSLTKILLGNKGSLTGDVTVHLNRTDLSNSVEQNQVFVVVEHIPYNNYNEVLKTDTVWDATGNYVPASNQLDINFNWGNAKDAYVVTLGGKNLSQKTEAESLTYTATSGRTVQNLSDASASNSQLSALSADAVGDYIQYELASLPAGKYYVSVGVKKYNSRGIFQLSVTEGSTTTNVGSPQDLYNATAQYPVLNLGTWKANATGSKSFKFTVTGKNASSSGTHPYSIYIDYIKLTPVKP